MGAFESWPKNKFGDQISKKDSESFQNFLKKYKKWEKYKKITKSPLNMSHSFFIVIFYVEGIEMGWRCSKCCNERYKCKLRTRKRKLNKKSQETRYMWFPKMDTSTGKEPAMIQRASCDP